MKTLPKTGTDEAVGGAASTRINSKTRKLENTLMAENTNNNIKTSK